MKKLLIVTGPQGSGNHLFSRILSMHPDVSGWDSLLDNYWVPSDKEPFAEYWVTPDNLTEKQFASSDYWLANVSFPFFYDGVRYFPKILEVADIVSAMGIEVEIAIIVRDHIINAAQQQRVRGEITTPLAQDYYYNQLLSSPYEVNFLDNEALFLHCEHYLKWASKLLKFPIDYDNPDIFKFLTVSPNAKYVVPVNEHWLDSTVLAGCEPMNTRVHK